jgi:hypothetical protein
LKEFEMNEKVEMMSDMGITEEDMVIPDTLVMSVQACAAIMMLLQKGMMLGCDITEELLELEFVVGEGGVMDVTNPPVINFTELLEKLQEEDLPVASDE